MLSAIHIIGQILFGGYFVWSGISHFSNSKGLIAYTASAKVPSPALAVYGSGALLVLGGLGILFGVYTQIASILLVIFLVPVTLTMHAFWNQTDPQMKMSNRVQFLKNVALLGAVLLFF